MEIFKDIKHYENMYQVSNLGNIKSLFYNNTSQEKLLAKTTSNVGYLRVGLNKNNKKKIFSVHRLVAIAFILNPEDKPQINHIDGNKENNNSSNLEWVTGKENVIHAYKHNLRVPTRGIERKDNISGYVGVDYHKTMKKWQARIQVNKKRIRIGFFNTAKEASNAYYEHVKTNKINTVKKRTSK